MSSIISHNFSCPLSLNFIQWLWPYEAGEEEQSLAQKRDGEMQHGSRVNSGSFVPQSAS